MTFERLIQRFPEVYHLAYAENWPLIQEHGLLSTHALLELLEVPACQREDLLTMHRPKSVAIWHPVVSWAARVRDQRPMNDKKLRACLVDMEVPEWYRVLNHRVFFWPTLARLDSMMCAYRGVPSCLVVLDTKRLVERYGPAMELSQINSGSTVYKAVPRGRETFVPVLDYQGRGVAEITVPDRVSPLDNLIVSVEILGADGLRTRVL